MSCLKFFETKGVALTGATPIEILPYNVLRKGLFISVTSGPALVAVGEAPDSADYVTVIEGQPLIFDSLVPLGAVWVKGAGTIVYGEAE